MSVQTARTTLVPVAASLLAIATIVGVVVAPAITFFVALAIAFIFGLDRAGRAADDVFTSLVAR